MPDLLAGTTITALDTPESVEYTEPANEDNIGTAFSAGTTECGGTFTAPTTGRVWVNVYGQVNSDSGVDVISVSFQVYLGSSSAGVLVQDAADTLAARILHNASSTNSATGQVRLMVSGLTAGSTYYVRTMHRAGSAGSNSDVVHRIISIEPAT